MSTPLDRVMAAYAARPDLSFPQDLCLHLRHAWVIVCPSYFVMGRPVYHKAPDEQLNDITYKFDYADAWFVWAAAGSLNGLIRLLPYPLPLIGWARRGRLRWYPTEKIYGRKQTKYSGDSANHACADTVIYAGSETYRPSGPAAACNSREAGWYWHN